MDQFQEYMTAALAAIAMAGGLCMQAILLTQGRPESDMPQWVIALVSGFSLYYVGNKQGKTQLNGNVTKLATAVQAFVDQKASNAVLGPAMGTPPVAGSGNLTVSGAPPA